MFIKRMGASLVPARMRATGTGRCQTDSRYASSQRQRARLSSSSYDRSFTSVDEAVVTRRRYLGPQQ